MTTYEITFTNNNTGRTKTDRFTEANEAAAKKAFKECYRHDDYTIESIAPVAEGVQASKEQERKALDQIKTIVATLGENSYIGTALAGCLEDAAENIENDFACSMYDRWQSAEQKLEAAKAEIEELKAKDAEKDKALATLGDKVAELVQNSITKTDLEDVIELAKSSLNSTEANVRKHAAEIVEYADKPDSAQFRDAVYRHRQSKDLFDYTFALINRLCEIKPAGN